MRMMGSMETFVLDTLPSPIGELRLVTDGEGQLCALGWSDCELRMRRPWALHYGRQEFRLQSGHAPEGIVGALQAYFEGQCRAIDSIPTAARGTPFQLTVWQALRRIPPGTTCSYGALAKAIGKPEAVRAVGAANGANPICIVVPCHRVIGGNGNLTGYGGGLERKRWLLRHEQTQGLF
jgi:methylated-DNA-[protein]-cysteine S-methyltransferase